jgi:hypothetical protein
MRFRLTSNDGHQQHELREGVQLVVGRAPSSDIAIFDPTISRRHAELFVTETGLHVRDLGSSNGTFHNGERLEEQATISPAGRRDHVWQSRVQGTATGSDHDTRHRMHSWSPATRQRKSSAVRDDYRQLPVRDFRRLPR